MVHRISVDFIPDRGRREANETSLGDACSYCNSSSNLFNPFLLQLARRLRFDRMRLKGVGVVHVEDREGCRPEGPACRRIESEPSVQYWTLLRLYGK